MAIKHQMLVESQRAAEGADLKFGEKHRAGESKIEELPDPMN